MGATVAWKQSKCQLTVAYKNTKLRDSETTKANDICIHSYSQFVTYIICSVITCHYVQFMV